MLKIHAICKNIDATPHPQEKKNHDLHWTIFIVYICINSNKFIIIVKFLTLTFEKRELFLSQLSDQKTTKNIQYDSKCKHMINIKYFKNKCNQN